MSNGLETRIERLMEAVNPEPPMLKIVVLIYYGGVDPEAVKPPQHYIGKFATAVFLGGTEREQRKALRRIRASGEYDQLPAFVPPALTGQAKAISAETDRSETA